MNPKTLGQPKIEFEKLPETLISESKIICWHFRNYPHDGKRNAIPSQIKHWETLRGLCYYLHFTREEIENQKVKISCPRPKASKNGQQCQTPCSLAQSPWPLSHPGHGLFLWGEEGALPLFELTSLPFFQDNGKLIFQCFCRACILYSRRFMKGVSLECFSIE